ncbi:MAG: hypothetical protein SF052_11055 [Bacteroidia bacterium]|nr:hypothetical protein [Bacteroidia bacterium]
MDRGWAGRGKGLVQRRERVVKGLRVGVIFGFPQLHAAGEFVQAEAGAAVEMYFVLGEFFLEETGRGICRRIADGVRLPVGGEDVAEGVRYGQVPAVVFKPDVGGFARGGLTLYVIAIIFTKKLLFKAKSSCFVKKCIFACKE